MAPVPRDTSIARGPREPARVIVWDPFIRLFHWLLVASVAVAITTSLILPITWLGWHLVAGIAALALVAARIVWGSLGSTYARFSSFVAAPGELLIHLRELQQGAAYRHRGHNPLGGAMIFALIAIIVAIGATGTIALGGALKIGPLAFAVGYAAGRTAWAAHQWLAYGLLGLIALHIGGAIYESRRTRENLVRAMIDGLKEARPADITAPPRQPSPGLATAVMAILLVGIAPAVIRMTGWPAAGVPDRPLDRAYARECGACHVAYHPSLLPAANWNVIMDELARHFGEDAELDPATAQSIRTYLIANAAEHYDTLAAHAFIQANPADPLRITATPFWMRRHASLSPQVFSTRSVGGKGQCDACHQDAAPGRFSPLAIAIPREPLP
ncbi:cytochrome b/b6 domain-containing protein [Hypericibacter sp.]|uniref:cytochrome b/b6 domain-containing protein n=1 Tax=Hypericibacter sp. TaxID=2705401 RepID=UPI003D6CC0CC